MADHSIWFQLDPTSKHAYDANARSRATTPERRLMLAVLESAADDMRYTDWRRDNVLAWIAIRDDESTFSFVALCETLGFDRQAVAAQLRKITPVAVVGRDGRERPFR